MRLLVTGGAGFIGANFVRYVLAQTTDVRLTNLDALTYAGNLASLADIADDPRYRFVEGDIRDTDLVTHSSRTRTRWCTSPRSPTSTGRSTARREFLETNLVGAGVVFEACRRAEVERVLHISTDEVYGSIPSRARSGRATRWSRTAPTRLQGRQRTCSHAPTGSRTATRSRSPARPTTSARTTTRRR
jgi:dTDP-D-glucose 4,6-dehydratase